MFFQPFKIHVKTRLLAVGVAGLLVVPLFLGGCAWTSTRILVNGTPVPQKTIPWKKLPHLDAGGSRVYYPAEAAAEAAAALKILRAEAGMIETTLGLKPTRFSIVLYGPLARPYEYVPRVSCPIDHPVWAIERLAGKPGQPLAVENSIYGTMTHERTEGLLVDSVGDPGLYIRNPYTRWIGDGLAEYLACKAERELNPAKDNAHLRNRLASLDGLPMHEYNLLLWRSPSWTMISEFANDEDWAKKELGKLGENARYYRDEDDYAAYALAFAFWQDLADRHGEAALKTFVAQLRTHPDLRNRSLCELLEQVTGERVYERCQHFDVVQAKAILQKAIAKTGSQSKERPK